MKSPVRRKILKRIAAACLLIAAVLCLLQLLNVLRFDMGSFNRSAEKLLARAQHIRENAAPEYQQVALAALEPNPNNGPFFRLDDLLGDAIAKEGPSTPSDAEGSGVLFSFEFDDANEPGLTPISHKSAATVSNGVLRTEVLTRNDLVNEGPIQIPRGDVGEIVMRARADKGKVMVLGWDSTENPEMTWRNRFAMDLIADGAFHTYVLNARNLLDRDLGTGGSIRRLMVRPSDVPGALVEIDFIRFVSKVAKYSAQPNGADYETIGKEMRRVLYMLPPQTLEYSLQIPQESPTLDFGTGLLIDDEPVSFKVMISWGQETKELYSEIMTTASAWRDARLDLSKWAGKEVRLALRVSGSRKNVAFWSSPFVSSDPRRRFNVIVLLEDALRRDHLDVGGHRLPTSPVRRNLLEKHGIVFENAISQATMTRSSTPTIMTGLLPTTTGVWHFSDALRDEYLTIAEIMHHQGFVTAYFTQNGNAGPCVGLHQGFSQLFDSETLGESTEGILGDRLIEWLKRHSHRNFFLYLHVMDPHGKYDPPAPYDRWYSDRALEGTPVERYSPIDPEWVKTPTLEGRRLLYDGEILHNDAQLQLLLDTLAELGISEKTLLSLISDHGEHLGEHGLWDHEPPGYLPVIHVPIDLVFPARFSASKRISQLVQLIDVMPTILELAEIDASQFLLQGDSLVDLIEGRDAAYWENRIVVSEEPVGMSKREPKVCGSFLFRNWHFISSPGLDVPFIPRPLETRTFNFRADPGETWSMKSLIADLYVKRRYWQVMKEVQSTNIEAHQRWIGADQDETLRFDPDVTDRLRGLGYVR